MALPNAPGKKIFISYRVQDTAADTGRFVDSLKQVFYEDQIFMDIEKLEPGVDFTQAIANSLESCDVLFAVIGPEWAGPANQNGITRINQSNDWVRIELETALKRNIRLIPVLVRGASLPEQHELPASLHPLLNRQTYEISNKRWKYDTDQLVNFLMHLGFQPKKRTIDTQTVQLPPQRSKSGLGKWVLYGLAALGVLVIVGLLIELSESGNSGYNQNTGSDYSKPYSDAGKTNQVPAVDKTDKPISEPAGNEQLVEEEPAVITKDVTGSWYDAPNQYYMHITQSGNTLELKSVNVGGLATGEGVGTITGDKISFKVQLYNVGVISGTATVPKDNNSLNGKFIIENNGASYTEPFHWTKQ